MRIRIRLIFFIGFLILISISSLSARMCLASDGNEKANEKVTKIDIDYNKEDKDVGLKRMEILDKVLSPEILEKKRSLIHSIEQDYNGKISELLQRITTPISRNTVITHVDVNFFHTEFESEIQVSQNVSVSIVLDYNGFENWLLDKKSKEDAISQIKGVIHNTFKIPSENISILVTSN